MTKINRIFMKGFKSFGNKVSMEFGNDFNCILGPNGSGKSNVLDALCFVLGKGSAKGLRADKAANLIYNGGKKKEPSKQGEVSIFFDNKKKIFPSDDEEIKITRIVKKTGQSIYKINDQTRTKQQVLDILSIANIDPNGYNIVLQGDIVQLVEMSPGERRVIIEDIAGISQYEEKKNKALNELSKVENKLNEADIILSERKTHLKELKKDRDQALKYKEVVDKLKKSKATQNHIQKKNREEKKQKIDKQIENFDSEIKKTQEQVDSLKKNIQETKDRIHEITKEIEEKGEKEQVTIMKDIEQLKIDIATNKTRISSNENEVNRVHARKDQLQGYLSELDERIKEFNNSKTTEDKNRESIQKNIDALQNKIVVFKKKHKIEDSNSMELDMDKFDEEAEEKQKQIQELREKQQNLLREKDKFEIYLRTIDEKIMKVLEVEKEHKTEIEKLKQKKTEFKKITLELNKLLNDDSSHAAQLGNARTKLLDANDTLAKLEAKSGAVKQSLADSMATRSILGAKNKFGEVFGTMSELGNVSSRFATALQVAAGARIKSIVVDTDKTAANCIKFLKKNKLGTATFLPLNKIKPSDSKSKVNGGGVHGNALELIDFEPKFKNAFSYVFGNTVVVDNIDVARRMGIGTNRMVTLDGDLVEKSGAMRGGFRQKKSGLGFQEKELTNEIKEKQKIVAEMNSIVSRIEMLREKNEEKIIQFRQFKANLEGEIIKSERSLHLESDDTSASKNEKKDYVAKLDEIEKSSFEIQKKLNSMIKELTDIKVKKQQLRSKINQMRSPTVLAELNTYEQKQTDFKEELIRIDANMKSAKMQMQNIVMPEKDKHAKVIIEIEKEEEKFKNDNETLKEKIKTQTKLLAEKEKIQKKFYGKNKSLYVEKDKLNSGMQKKENKLIRTEETIRNIEQRRNLLSINRAEIKAELAGIIEESKKYEGLEIFKGKTEEELKKEIWQMERLMESAGSINMRALEVYDKIEKEYNLLIEKQQKLGDEKENVLVMINEIETKKKDSFMKIYDIIDEFFQEMFKKLTTKGEAFLELENPKDPLSAGLLIKVRITGRKYLDIRSLSGGEKTLTALAFIFAIQEHDPASFYVFDEVDAALDKKNSEKLSWLVENYSKKAQYIMVSHNDNIISRANTLYGVSMGEHSMSKVVSLKL